MVFSHGLTGSREMYTAAVGELVSRGMVALCVEHTDGSATLARAPDGSVTPFDFEVGEIEGDAYIWARRRQGAKRIAEFRALLDAARLLSQLPARVEPQPPVPPPHVDAGPAGTGDAGPVDTDGKAGAVTGAPRDELLRAGPKDRGGAEQLIALLSGRLDRSRIIAGGHSMGGVTALSTSLVHEEAVAALLLVDPANKWQAIRAGRVAWAGEESVREAEEAEEPSFVPCDAGGRPLRARRTFEHLLVLSLYSQSWHEEYFANEAARDGHLLQHVRGRFTTPGYRAAGSEFAFIEGTTHTSFSDVPATFPRWLCQAMGLLRRGTSAEQALLRFRAHLVRFAEAHALLETAPAIGPAAALLAREAGLEHLRERVRTPGGGAAVGSADSLLARATRCVPSARRSRSAAGKGRELEMV
jgi:pimeloyl-ACP methyl ester carboxylesterase